MTEVRLGIIGMSEGNGHPYSWSAICNGYVPEYMAECGFPTIPTYLAKQRFPEDCISNARVTHVWTQDKSLSHHIAKAAHIASVVSAPKDMIGSIDAVLLARDDAENHLRFADPFLEAGLPIYIDKPIAFDRKAAEALFRLQVRDAQLFSCSALQFAPEMLLAPDALKQIGGVKHISAQVPNAWKKYAIHVIDPIISNCGPLNGIGNVNVRRFGPENDATEVAFTWGGEDKTCKITAYGGEPRPISVTYAGPHGTLQTEFVNSFAAFKAALTVFLKDSVWGQRSHADRVLAAMDIVELGV